MDGFHRNMLVLVGILAFINLVQAEDQQGFISLDCGLPIDASPYTEPYNGLIYSSDEKFVQSGKTGKVGSKWSDYLKVYRHLRYFPDGKKNCINLMGITKDTTYVIRADFLYGNYDGRNSYPIFDLYLGPNKWATLDLQGEEAGLSEEIIHISRSNSLQVCVVKTGISTPFISSLELRPLRNGSYLTQNGSLKYSDRWYFNNSESGDYMRYPQDIHDRNWYPIFQPLVWRQITTNININTSNEYEPPNAAISMAVTPINVSAPLTITWYLRPLNAKFYLYLHFVEIQSLSNETREFNVLLNGQVINGPYSPQKLQIHTFQSTSPMTCDGGKCILQLVKSSRSTLPPLLNGLEILTVLELPLVEANSDDVAAIKNIQNFYELRRIDWQGDPCTPKQFSWDGLNCSYLDTSTPPRVKDLSSKGLSGIITPAIQNLTQLEKLDLSNNSLTGGVPEFLAKMEKLLDINLSGNNFSGSVPQILLDRVKEGLKLNLQPNPRPCSSDSCKSKDVKDKNKFMIPVIASVASVAVVIIVLVIIYISMKKKTTGSKAPHELSSVPETEKSGNKHEQSILTTKRRFTYSDVLVMTKNFQRVLGNGGFGVVYHGHLNDYEEVAVKVLSQSSTQGYKHFKAEVELLMRVHHVNLVSLIGYCDEGDRLALIYEYMPNGDLKGHLSAGKLGGSALNWASRLGIAAEAAQGLEYLHIGCKPPMIHRDVKSTNILLDQNIKAKLADFGLSRSFPVMGETHVSTVVAGTPGYLDPDYYRTNWLTEKSDVYSFGVVLLEIFTNQPVIEQTRQRSHIAEWIGLMLSKGDLRNIMDPTMLGDYDVGSVWKALEIAMSCVNPSSIGRPGMSKVVSELKECLRLENTRRRGSQDMDSRSFHEISMTFDDMEGTPRAR